MNRSANNRLHNSKLHSSSQKYIQELFNSQMEKAQNGIGYNIDNPSSEFDSYLNIAQSAGAGFLGSQLFHQGYYNDKYANDPAKAKRRTRDAALFSGITGGVRSIFAQVKEARDYGMEYDRIRNIQANNYYRAPVDNYSYSEFSGNQYNNTAYKNGGKVKCQTGGLTGDSLLNGLPAPARTGSDTAEFLYDPIIGNAQPGYVDPDYYKNQYQGQNWFTPEDKAAANVNYASLLRDQGYTESMHTKTKSSNRLREKKYGGMLFQDGGATPESYYAASTDVFDSTSEDSAPVVVEEAFYSAGSLDAVPMSGGSIDLSKVRPTLGNEPIAVQKGTVTDVINQIASHESGGRYDVVNTSGGAHAINATGKYQFVPKYWYKQIAEFQGTTGKSMQETMDTFKRNPATQDAFMQHVTNNIYLPEVKRLLPLARTYGLGQNELIKMLHYRGIADTRKRLETGNFKVSAEEKARYNNPDILSYIKSR